jgi:hypothetical protein
MARIRSHLTYANVMATIAVFIALGGGAYAVYTAPKNSVVTKSIKDGAVTYPKLACKGNGAADKMVRAGSVCIDKYEASVWSSPTGGTQYGLTGDDYPCAPNGQDCEGKIFARSVAGVPPSAYMSWFQAQQALANSGKRLPSNAEWQQAVAGTPDSAACNVGMAGSENTGANAGCVSDWGANDMVGNLWEWVADWDEEADFCDHWPAAFGGDYTCLGKGEGDTPTRFPGALIRGGASDNNSQSGPFAIGAARRPSDGGYRVGFRGAR